MIIAAPIVLFTRIFQSPRAILAFGALAPYPRHGGIFPWTKRLHVLTRGKAALAVHRSEVLRWRKALHEVWLPLGQLSEAEAKNRNQQRPTSGPWTSRCASANLRLKPTLSGLERGPFGASTALRRKSSPSTKTISCRGTPLSDVSLNSITIYRQSLGDHGRPASSFPL